MTSVLQAFLLFCNGNGIRHLQRRLSKWTWGRELVGDSEKRPFAPWTGALIKFLFVRQQLDHQVHSAQWGGSPNPSDAAFCPAQCLKRWTNKVLCHECPMILIAENGFILSKLMTDDAVHIARQITTNTIKFMWTHGTEDCFGSAKFGRVLLFLFNDSK